MSNAHTRKILALTLTTGLIFGLVPAGAAMAAEPPGQPAPQAVAVTPGTAAEASERFLAAHSAATIKVLNASTRLTRADIYLADLQDAATLVSLIDPAGEGAAAAIEAQVNRVAEIVWDVDQELRTFDARSLFATTVSQAEAAITAAAGTGVDVAPFRSALAAAVSAVAAAPVTDWASVEAQVRAVASLKTNVEAKAADIEALATARSLFDAAASAADRALADAKKKINVTALQRRADTARSIVASATTSLAVRAQTAEMKAVHTATTTAHLNHAKASFVTAVKEWEKAAKAAGKKKINLYFATKRVTAEKRKTGLSIAQAYAAGTVVRGAAAEASAKIPLWASIVSTEQLIARQNHKVYFNTGRVVLRDVRSKVTATADVAALNKFTSRVNAAAKQVRADVAKYDKAYPKQPAYLKDFRKRLDQVGGKDIPLSTFNGQCGPKVNNAVACAWTGTPNGGAAQVWVAPVIAKSSAKYRTFVAAHEMAHIYQFKVYAKLNASKQYKTLFGGNIEKLADCMANARGYYPGYSRWADFKCSGKHLTFAKNMWKGKVG